MQTWEYLPRKRREIMIDSIILITFCIYFQSRRTTPILRIMKYVHNQEYSVMQEGKTFKKWPIPQLVKYLEDTLQRWNEEIEKR